jgi:peptidoglycan/LPS O-acetylase OafA/YrhL
MQSNNRRYIPLLDVLRAGAALWVVLYHVVTTLVPVGDGPRSLVGSDNPVMIVLSQGWLAVSLFVMLSGYSLSLGLTKGDIDWVAYLKARWLRVAPLYLVMLFLGLLATVPDRRPGPGSLFAAVSMLPVPGTFVPRPWLATAWSVKVELVLYLCIPALVYVARRYKPVPLIAMAGTLGLVLFVAMQATTSTVDILYWGIPGRLVEFTVGFALGYAGRTLSLRHRRAAIVAGCSGFLAVTFVANRSGGFHGLTGPTRLALYGATLVLGGLLLAAVDQRPKPSSSRLVAAVSAVGSWSYSTYLWHMVVITLVVMPLMADLESALGVRGALAVGAALTVGIVMVVSWASFNLIERPFLSLRPQYVRAAAENAASVVPVLRPATARTHLLAGPVARPVLPRTRTAPSAEAVPSGRQA